MNQIFGWKRFGRGSGRALTSWFSIVVFSALPCFAHESFSRVLPEEAVGVLKKYCAKCHHYDKQSQGLDILDRDALIKIPTQDAQQTSEQLPFVAEGRPEKSRIWSRMDEKSMPPSGEPQPDDQELDLIRRWIEQGARFPNEAKRAFLNEEEVLEIIGDDYRKLSRDDRKETRYFSLAHLWNDPNTNDKQLRMVRAGLSKLLNSLSNQPRIVPPRVVDVQRQTVFAIRLSDYGWTRSTWSVIVKQNPYAIKRSTELARKVNNDLGNELPYLRADWFIHAASRPYLYHAILSLPEDVGEIEDALGISVRANYESGQIARAAFKKSGVSQQNRMVERHEFPHKNGKGYYWKSYDMRKKQENEGDFLRRPLEPEHLFKPGAVSFLSPFQHDGGEIIWSLPNGMQAYMLVDKSDQRIDIGPSDIVYDSTKNSGSYEILNGISCMGCHSQGMVRIPSNDVIDKYREMLGSKAAKVRQIYQEMSKLNELLDADRQRFRGAVEQAVLPFVRSAEEREALLKDEEPITASAREYRKDLDIVDAARELGEPATDRLMGWVLASQYPDLNLSGFSRGFGKISRDDWEKEFPKVIHKLGLGTRIAYP